MSDILNKQIVLALNRNWQGIDFRTVKKTFEDIMSQNPDTGEAPFLPLDLVYETNPDGTFNTESLISARPVSVAEWMALPVRSCDIGITTARGEIRVPTIIVASRYASVPQKTPKFSPEAIWQRDRGTCQATGRKLSRDQGNMGHNVARTNGGRRTFDNIALLDKEINRQQGTKTFVEMGWTHIKPKAPKPTRVFFTSADIKHPSQLHFVN